MLQSVPHRSSQRTRMWNLVLTATLIFGGLAITIAGARLAAANSFELWRQGSIADAERLSSELQYRVLRNREPLIAMSSLYSGSDDVTQDELVTARDQILEITGLEVDHSLAFVTRATGQAAYVIQQVAGQLALLPEQPGAALHPVLEPAIATSSTTRNLTIGALFRYNGSSYLPITIAASNAGTAGTLLYLIDFSQLLTTVLDDVLTPGITLRLTHPADDTLDHASVPALRSEPETSHTVDIDMGLHDWQLEWMFDADYATAADRRLVYAVLAGGALVTALLSFIIYTLLQQRNTITLQIRRKTDELQKAQKRLVQQEKMAALGQLVAGISHELNTPIGNTLLAATALGSRSAELRDAQRTGGPDADQLSAYVGLALESSRLIEKNARRATELITSFKQVAVDQSSERRRRFGLAETIDEILQTLQPRLKPSGLRVLLSVPEDIVMDSYPGALYQVISNLISNTMIHAFPTAEGFSASAGVSAATTERGIMALSVTNADKEHILIEFSDDGPGIPAAIRSRVFEPFFTTRLGTGGSGLGLHIVFTLVHEVLGGDIRLEDTEQGAVFVIRLPRQAPRQT